MTQLRITAIPVLSSLPSGSKNSLNRSQKALHEFQEPIQAFIRKKILHLQSTDVENVEVTHLQSIDVGNEEDKGIETNSKNVDQQRMTQNEEEWVAYNPPISLLGLVGKKCREATEANLKHQKISFEEVCITMRIDISE